MIEYANGEKGTKDEKQKFLGSNILINNKNFILCSLRSLS